jgi:hypothetical protein
MTGGLISKTLMTLRIPEEGNAGSGLKKLRLSFDERCTLLCFLAEIEQHHTLCSTYGLVKLLKYSMW